MSVYIIAEVGSSHAGVLGNAMQSAKVFAECGADAIKFQDHYGQELTPGAEHPPWFRGPRDIETRAQYIWSTCFAIDEWQRLADYCHELGVDYICSPFSVEAAKRQAPLVDRWKVASGQVTNIEMLKFIGTTGKPVILSAGLSTEDEQVSAWMVTKGKWVACSSLYPCPMDLVRYEPEYDGLSDHTEGSAAALGAVAMGATIIEKHVTLSRHLYGTDTSFALEPCEFRRFVADIRALEVMLMGRDEAEYQRRVAGTRAAFMHGAGQ